MDISINISAENITINDIVLTYPISVSAVEMLLGSPRQEDATYFFWDDIGVLMHAVNGEVKDISIKLQNDELSPDDATRPFAGDLTVDGISWFDYLTGGERKDISVERGLGEYSLTGYLCEDCIDNEKDISTQSITSLIIRLYPADAIEQLIADDDGFLAGSFS